MAIKLLGNTGVRRVSTERSFDVNLGWQTVMTFEGFEAACVAYGASLRNAKLRISQKQGPWYTLTATFGNLQDGGTEVPVDKYEITTEIEQIDFRASPRISALADFDAVKLALWIKENKEAIAKGEDVNAVDPNQERLYTIMARGVTSVPAKKIVLRRRRTFSADYASPTTTTAIENIYLTAALIRVFGVPAAVQAMLPGDPGGADTPEDCTWGWLERSNNSEVIPAYNTVQEVRDWVFHAWENILFNFIT